MGTLDSLTIAVISGVGSGLAAGIVSGFVTLRKVRQDLAAQYDADLREQRLKHYQDVWTYFEPLTITRPRSLTKNDLDALSGRLRDWYFFKGGLYMSTPSTRFYNILQEALARLVARDAEPAKDDLNAVRFFASSFRARLTEDVGTRRRAMFSPPAVVAGWRRRSIYRHAGFPPPEEPPWKIHWRSRRSSDSSPQRAAPVGDGMGPPAAG
jgi:hypothetical protein